MACEIRSSGEVDMEGIGTVISTAVANLLVAMTVLLLWWQVRDLRRSVQSATYQTIVQMFDAFAKTMIQYPELHAYLVPDAENRNSQQIRAEWAIAMRFDWFESIVIQKMRYNAIPDDIYIHWMRILEYELRNPFFQSFWNQFGSMYHPLLREEVERRLKS